MRTASSSVGSSTVTGWNLRSSAASFSMYLRYSAMVVAPINWISPLAREGFMMLDASMAPSAPPAPMIVCSSSRNKIIFPSSVTSFNTFLIRSSNSPRYLLPATIPDRSKVSTLLFCTVKGTSPATIRAASPSTTAVLPTPGSPTRQGLFFVRRLKICTTLRISSSLPTTGSSLPSLAKAVRSLLYCSSVDCFALRSPFFPRSSLYRLPSCPIAIRVSTYIFCTLTPNVFNRRTATFSPSLISASSRCSVPVCFCPKRAA